LRKQVILLYLDELTTSVLNVLKECASFRPCRTHAATWRLEKLVKNRHITVYYTAGNFKIIRRQTMCVEVIFSSHARLLIFYSLLICFY
jgi:hypothetical protein